MTETVVQLVTHSVTVEPAVTLDVAVTDDGSQIVNSTTAVAVVSRDVIVVDTSSGESGGGDPAGTAAALVAAHNTEQNAHQNMQVDGGNF